MAEPLAADVAMAEGESQRDVAAALEDERPLGMGGAPVFLNASLEFGDAKDCAEGAVF